MATSPDDITRMPDAVTLAQWLRQIDRGLGERLRLFLALSEIVDRAHRELVVFGHLDSESILVTPDGTPILRGEVDPATLEDVAYPPMVVATRDNLDSMAVDNIASGKVPGLDALGITPAALAAIAPGYLRKR